MASPNATQLDGVISRNQSANGLAVIIANNYRDYPGELPPLDGALKDSECLMTTFTSLNISCYVRSNVTASDLRAIVHEVAGYRSYPGCYKRLVFTYSGHGTLDQLKMQDGKPISIQQEILERFEPQNLLELARIPKVFLFDTCRGDDETKSYLVPRGGSSYKPYKVPESSNMLIAYSTLEGKKAFECKDKGGIWVQHLCERLKEDASIDDILTNVNNDVIKELSDSCMQQPIKYSTLHEVINFAREAKRAPLVSRSICTSGGKNPVQTLKELCDKKKWKQPVYDVKEDSRKTIKKFICTIYLEQIGEYITGDYRRSTSDAKHSAAAEALNKLNP